MKTKIIPFDEERFENKDYKALLYGGSKLNTIPLALTTTNGRGRLIIKVKYEEGLENIISPYTSDVTMEVEDDYEIGTPMMYRWRPKKRWGLGYYAGKGKVFREGLKSGRNYIPDDVIPFEEFDPINQGVVK